MDEKKCEVTAGRKDNNLCHLSLYRPASLITAGRRSLFRAPAACHPPAWRARGCNCCTRPPPKPVSCLTMFDDVLL